MRKTAAATVALSGEGRILGTVQYLAPEQARGQVERVDKRSDVYSVGAMLYALLAGERPYKGFGVDGPGTILERVREGPPLPLEEPPVPLLVEPPVPLQASPSSSSPPAPSTVSATSSTSARTGRPRTAG